MTLMWCERRRGVLFFSLSFTQRWCSGVQWAFLDAQKLRSWYEHCTDLLYTLADTIFKEAVLGRHLSGSSVGLTY